MGQPNEEGALGGLLLSKAFRKELGRVAFPSRRLCDSNGQKQLQTGNDQHNAPQDMYLDKAIVNVV
jgi:hypothetical protein